MMKIMIMATKMMMTLFLLVFTMFTTDVNANGNVFYKKISPRKGLT